MKVRVTMSDMERSSWRLCAGWMALMTFLCVGCALSPAAQQMYDGPPLPKDQVGIIKTGCTPEGKLNIMVTRLDGKDVPDACADFAVMPGAHQVELSAEQMALNLAAPTMGSGGVLGAPLPGMSGTAQQVPQVVWRSQSPLRITCSVPAGKDVTIVGNRTAGSEWAARCQ